MSENDNRPEPGASQPLATDTLADKAVRFGCGAIPAALIVVFIGITGLLEPFSTGGFLLSAVVVIGVCGVLSVAFGERFIRGVLRVIKWL